MFLQNETDQNVTVKGQQCKAMISDFFVPELEDVDVDDLWCQQDASACHTTNETINLLKERACGVASKIIRFTTAGLSFVGLCEVETIDALAENIQRVIASMWPRFLHKVVENWYSRLEVIGASSGGHLFSIIFKV